MRANTAAASPAPHWAAVVAEAGTDRAAAALDERRDQARQADLFRDLVARDGRSFFERVAADMQEAQRVFNERVGDRVIDFRPTSDALSLRSVRDGAFVLVVPDLQTEFRHRPGAMVTVRQYGRDGAQPYDLVMEGAELRLWVAGQALTAEAFTRFVLEPWLRALDVTRAE